ncbi:PIN-like domain-containing protein [Nocardia carnea]|nr:PIN-like domain-containing protein [Nocardia carnea]
MNGLYDGEFIGYRAASNDDLETALGEAIVAIDANVLLDLYRFRPRTSQDLIKTLESLGDRLVVPHQALREFWRHRQRSHGSPHGATKTATDLVAKGGRTAGDALTVWAKAVGVDDGELSDLLARVDGFVSDVQGRIQDFVRDTKSERDGDSILDQLESLLAGRVTPPLADDEWLECVAEANRRIEAEVPPGYKDAQKQDTDSPEGGAGDYLVWYQATRYAHAHGKDLIIVTRDEKEDWWWRQQSTFIGPRPELSVEYHELSGRRLFLM